MSTFTACPSETTKDRIMIKKPQSNNTHLPYIKDKQVFKAVMFARVLREEYGAPLAIHKAAKYYKVEEHSVAHYMGKLGAKYKKFYNKKGAQT